VSVCKTAFAAYEYYPVLRRVFVYRSIVAKLAGPRVMISTCFPSGIRVSLAEAWSSPSSMTAYSIVIMTFAETM